MIPAFTVLRHWKLALGGLLLIALAVQTWRLASVQQDLRDARAEIVAANARIELQNAAVDQLRREGEAARARADEAVRRGRERITVVEREAREIERPRPSTGRCETPREILEAGL